MEIAIALSQQIGFPNSLILTRSTYFGSVRVRDFESLSWISREPDPEVPEVWRSSKNLDKNDLRWDPP